MRTTVELSDRLYRRLRTAATERGMRGFSPIVEEAVEGYLASEDQRRDLVRAIEAAGGTWGDEEVVELERAREEAWAGWRPDRSSTPTS